MSKKVINAGILVLVSIAFVFFFNDLIDEKSKESEIKQAAELSQVIEEASTPMTNETGSDLIDISIDDVEPEIYNSDQIYFEGTSTLYRDMSFQTVEKVLYQIQKYIHDTFDPNILNCSIINYSNQDGIIRFHVIFDHFGIETEIEVIFDPETLDTTIAHSL